MGYKEELELTVYVIAFIAYVLIIFHYSPTWTALPAILLVVGVFLFFISQREESIEGPKKEIYLELQDEGIIPKSSIWEKVVPLSIGNSPTVDVLDYLKSKKLPKKADDKKKSIKPILHDIEHIIRDHDMEVSQEDEKKILEIFEKNLIE